MPCNYRNLIVIKKKEWKRKRNKVLKWKEGNERASEKMESKEVLSFTRNRQSFTTVDPAAEQLILLPRRKLPIKVLSNSHYIKRAQWKLDCYEVLLLSGETFLRKLYCFSTCYEDIRKSRDLVIFLERKLQARYIRNTDIINYTFYLLQESNLKIPYTVCQLLLHYPSCFSFAAGVKYADYRERTRWAILKFNDQFNINQFVTKTLSKASFYSIVFTLLLLYYYLKTIDLTV